MLQFALTILERTMTTEKLNILPRSPNFASWVLGMLAIFAVLFGALSTGEVMLRSESDIEGAIISAPWAVTEKLNDVIDDSAKIIISPPYLVFEGNEQNHIHFEADPAW